MKHFFLLSVFLTALFAGLPSRTLAADDNVRIYTPTWKEEPDFYDPTNPMRKGGYAHDMFEDQQWVFERPDVPSDRGTPRYQSYYGDIIPYIPPMWNEDADVFDRVAPPFTYGREDMLPQRRLTSTPQHSLRIDGL